MDCTQRLDPTIGAARTSWRSRVMARYGDGHHRVSLDGVAASLRETGAYMQSEYKEKRAWAALW
jgi:hypothetical protein